MRRICANLPDELNARFRKEVGRRFGANKGVIQQALMEAIELWIAKGKTKELEDPHKR